MLSHSQLKGYELMPLKYRFLRLRTALICALLVLFCLNLQAQEKSREDAAQSGAENPQTDVVKNKENETQSGVPETQKEAQAPQSESAKNETAPKSASESKTPDAVLENLEATAYAFSTQPLDTPTNSTFIDRSQIEKSAATGLLQLIQKEGNIMVRSVTGNSTSGDLSMRGFGEGSQSRILVMVDGQRMNPADMGSINWAQIPLGYVDSVEILRGAHSAEYGNNAVAGVIKIKTLKGSDLNQVYANALFGSYGYMGYNLSAIGRYQDFYGTFNANYMSDDGYRANSSSWAEGGSASVGYDISDHTIIELGANISRSYQQYPGPLPYDHLNQTALTDPRASLQNDAGGTTDGGLFTLELKNTGNSGLFDLQSGANMKSVDWSLNGAYSKNDQWTATLLPQYEFFVGDKSSATVGLDYSFDNVDSHRYLDPDYQNNYANADMQRNNFAPYAQAELSVSDDLILSMAGRIEASNFDAYSIEYDPITVPKYIYIRGVKYPNPYPLTVLEEGSYNKWLYGPAANFGASYALTQESSLFFRFDQLYRYPTTDEIFSYEGYPMAKIFQDDLKPETGQNYEVGYKLIKQEWSFTANGFMQFLKNEIAYDNTQNLNVNLDPTMRCGADFELAYDAKFWGASAMTSIVQAEFADGPYEGNTVPLVPETNSTFALYVKPLDFLKLTARANYVGAQYQGNDYENLQLQIPDYATFDFQADVRFCKYAYGFIALENAFDKRYLSAAWTGSGAYPGLGRMLKIGITIKY